MLDLLIGEPKSQGIFHPFCFHLNELSKIRLAISIYECMNCIESHYLQHKAYRCDVFEETTGACRKIWNETNLQEFAQDWMF